MEGDPGVRVVYTGIRKQWRDTEGGDVWLRLASDAAALDDVERAVDVANERSLASGAAAMGGFASTVPGGLVVCVSGGGDIAGLLRWVDDFAEQLSGEGLSGELRSVPPARPPAILSASLPPTATVFLAWVRDQAAVPAEPMRNAHWLVPEDATTAIVDNSCAWARVGEGTSILRQNVYWLTAAASTVPRGIERAVLRTGLAGVEEVTDDGATCRHVFLGPAVTAYSSSSTIPCRRLNT